MKQIAIIKKIIKHYKKIGIGIAIMFLLSFFVNVKLILFIVLAIFSNTWLALLQMKFSMPSDFELSTLAVVIATLVFGLKIGIFVAITTKLVATILRGKIIIDNVFQIMSYSLAAIFVSWFSGGDIVVLGLLATFIANMFMFTISQFLLGVSLFDNLAYTLTNVFGNFLFFTIIANPIYLIMK
ncbi:MAG: hypothetical protein AABW92_03405 [Nanoarchaeota archaeon]